jgi:hypothetical protein
MRSPCSGRYPLDIRPSSPDASFLKTLRRCRHRSPRCPRLPCRRAPDCHPLLFLGGYPLRLGVAPTGRVCLYASVFHAGLVRGLAFRLLPPRPHQLDRVLGVKPGVEHLVVRRAEEREIIGTVVTGAMVEVREVHETWPSRVSETTDHTTANRVSGLRNAASLGLFSRIERRFGFPQLPSLPERTRFSILRH